MEGDRNRRSSILKPQKARNPLSDLDFTETVEDISAVVTGRPSMKRVSFSCTNFVKEFAADSEKNTIWNSTYEETVNSDSTQSSENAHNTLGMHTQSVDSVQVTSENIHCETINDDGNISKQVVTSKEQQACVFRAETTTVQTHVAQTITNKTVTKTVNLVQQLQTRKISINFNEQGGEDIITDSSLSSNDASGNPIALGKENVQPEIRLNNSNISNSKSTPRQGKQSSLTNIENVATEVIQQLPAVKVLKNKVQSPIAIPTINDINVDKSRGAIRKSTSGSGPYTRNKTTIGIVSSDKENIQHNFCAANNLMGGVDQSLNKENINISDNVRSVSNKGNLQTVKNDVMELTSSVSSNQPGFKSMKNVTEVGELTRNATNLNTSSFKVYRNRTVVSENTMDCTQQSLPQVSPEVTMNKTITSEDDMEFTRQTIDDNMESSEKTQSSLMSDENMEFTQHISNKTMKNRTVMSDDNTMELTIEAGAPNRTNRTRNKTLLSSEDLDFTRQVATMDKENCNIVGNKTVAADANMEFTLVIPDMSKANSTVLKRKSIVNAGNMKFTQAVAAFYKTSPEMDITKREVQNVEFYGPTPAINRLGNKTVINDDDMEFTKLVPALSVNQTVPKEDNLEIAQPSTMFSNSRSDVASNEKSDIHFDFAEITLNKTKAEVSGDTTMVDDDTECAKPAALLNQTSSQFLENAHQVNDLDMEFTKIVFALNRSPEVARNEITIDGNRKFTQQQTDLLNQTSSQICQKKEHYPNMEFTQLAPVLNETVPRAKENKSVSDNVMELSQHSVVSGFKNYRKSFEISNVNMELCKSQSAISNREICMEPSTINAGNESLEVFANKSAVDGNEQFIQKMVNSKEISRKETSVGQENEIQANSFPNNVTGSETYENIVEISDLDITTPQKDDATDRIIKFSHKVSTSSKTSFEVEIKVETNIANIIQPDVAATKENWQVIGSQSTMNDNYTDAPQPVNNADQSRESRAVPGDETKLTQQVVIETEVELTWPKAVVEDNLDYTHLSSINQESHDVLKNKIRLSDYMENSERVTMNKTACDGEGNKTRMSTASMEFTKSIPALNKENTEVAENKAVLSDNMEFTQHLTTLNKEKCKNEEIKTATTFVPTSEVTKSNQSVGSMKFETSLNNLDSQVWGSKAIINYNNGAYESQNVASSNVDLKSTVNRGNSEVVGEKSIASSNMEIEDQFIFGNEAVEVEAVPILNKRSLEVANNKSLGLHPIMDDSNLEVVSNKTNFEVTKGSSAIKVDHNKFSKVEDISDDSEFTPRVSILSKTSSEEARNSIAAKNAPLESPLSLENKSVTTGDDMKFNREPVGTNKTILNFREQLLKWNNAVETNKTSFDAMEFKRVSVLSEAGPSVPVHVGRDLNKVNNSTKLDSKAASITSFNYEKFMNDSLSMDTRSPKVVQSHDYENVFQEPDYQNAMNVSDNRNMESIPFWNKGCLDSDNEKTKITLHSTSNTMTGLDFHNTEYCEQSHQLALNSDQDIIVPQNQKFCVEAVDLISSCDDFAMDVDITPVKDTKNKNFRHSLVTDKKKPMQSSFQLIYDQPNDIDLQLPTSPPTKNLENQEASKHFDTSVAHDEGDRNTHNVSGGASYLGTGPTDAKANAIASYSICSEVKTPGSSFHTTFNDDTHHLINYSLNHKQPKSDFSKIITGDLNPTFLSSKFMHLSNFSSGAFPISLDNTRNNQTHLDCTESDKDKSCKESGQNKLQQNTYIINNKSDTYAGLERNQTLDCTKIDEDKPCHEYTEDRLQQTFVINNQTTRIHSDTFPIHLESSHNNQTFHCAEESKANDRTVAPPSETSPVVLEGNNQRHLDCLEIKQNLNLRKLTEEPQKTTFIIGKTNDMAQSDTFMGLGITDTTQASLSCRETDGRVSPEIKVEEVIRKQKRKSSENIETAVDNKKQLVGSDEISFSDQLTNSCHSEETLHISQENLTLSNSIDDSFLPISMGAQQVIGNITRSINTSSMDATDLAGEENENRLSSKSKAMWETYLKNNNSVRHNMDEFKVKMMSHLATVKRNSALINEKCEEALKKLRLCVKEASFEEAQGSLGSSTDWSYSDPTMNDGGPEEMPFFEDNLNMELEKVLTLKEKIEEKRIQNKNLWSIFSADENKYEFHVLFKTIRLVVFLNEETGVVNKTEIHSHISDDSEATALFVHKIFKERLTQKHIQSAVGDRYDILTLLDYVNMNMQKMLDVLAEFDHFAYVLNLEMDPSFRVSFQVINPSLRIAWCISLDMSDVDNITEDSVSAWAIVGTVKEGEVKNLVKSCPRGLSLLKNFIKNLLTYIDVLSKRRTLLKMKFGNVPKLG